MVSTFCSYFAAVSLYLSWTPLRPICPNPSLPLAPESGDAGASGGVGGHRAALCLPRGAGARAVRLLHARGAVAITV